MSALFLPFFFCVSLSAASGKDGLKEARAAVLDPSVPASSAVLKYSELSRRAADPEAVAEYAYVLGYYGLAEESLYHMDRALIAAPGNCTVRFYLSELLKTFGQKAGAEISGCRPDWLKEPLKLPGLRYGFFLSSDNFYESVNLLMAQKRYAEAAVLFASVCPENGSRCYGGYAIALDRLGAYKSAAAMVEKDIALSSDEEHKKAAETYKNELLAKPAPVPGGEGKKKLKGRYLAYLGGSVSGYSDYTLYNLKARAGKFISERFDVSADLGYTGGYGDGDYNGFSLGFTLRGNAPLGRTPFSLTLAGKAERVPAPEDNFSLIISPGLSWFTGGGSADVYLDFPLSGAYEGSPEISAGYTVYF